MIHINKVWFKFNKIHIKLSDGRIEVRHLLNWPGLIFLDKENLNKNNIDHSTIYWPKLNFSLELEDILSKHKL